MKMPERRRSFLCTKCGSHECIKGYEKADTPPCAKCGYLGFAQDLDYTEEQMKQYGRDLLEAAAQLAEGPMHFSNPIAADLRKLKETL